jgi:tetratricopeptide (TPR) repeat protein
MNRFILALVALVFVSSATVAQKHKKEKKLNEEETSELLGKLNMNSIGMLHELSQNACNCIDSVDKAEVDKSKKMSGIADCIDRQVGAYQIADKLFNSLQEPNNKISISMDKGSSEYRRYYYALERQLKDSCAVMNTIVKTNDEPSEKSYSSNPDAEDAYNKGVALLAEEKYEDCIPWFEKAVAIDSEFAFAWDNLGISLSQNQ